MFFCGSPSCPFHCISIVFPSTSVSHLLRPHALAARVQACCLSVTTYLHLLGVCLLLMCSPPDSARQPSRSRDLSKGGCPGFLCKKDEGCAGDANLPRLYWRGKKKKTVCGIREEEQIYSGADQLVFFEFMSAVPR